MNIISSFSNYGETILNGLIVSDLKYAGIHSKY